MVAVTFWRWKRQESRSRKEKWCDRYFGHNFSANGPIYFMFGKNQRVPVLGVACCALKYRFSC